MTAETIACELWQHRMRLPDGSVAPAWIVSAQEPGGVARVVFSGPNAGDKAYAYARANYSPVHFRMTAEPGEYATRGNDARFGQGMEAIRGKAS